MDTDGIACMCIAARDLRKVGAGVGIGEGILCSRKGDAYLAHWLKSYRSVVGCSVVGLGDGRPVGSAEG